MFVLDRNVLHFCSRFSRKSWFHLWSCLYQSVLSKAAESECDKWFSFAQDGETSCRRVDLECPDPDCTHPGRVRGECCRSCNTCEYERRSYRNGATFTPVGASPCVSCICTVSLQALCFANLEQWRLQPGKR